MNLDPTKLRDRIRRKAEHSRCRFRVVAVGLDSRDRYISIATNRPRFYRAGGGWHAEEVLMHRSPPNLARIIIARIGLSGDFLPIEPCDRCLRLAEKFGVEIESMSLPVPTNA